MSNPSKTTQTVPVPSASPINTNVLLDAGSNNVTPLQYNPSWSGGYQTTTVVGVQTTGVVIKNAPGRACVIECISGVATISVYDQNAGPNSGNPVVAPIGLAVGGEVRPMRACANGILLVITGSSPVVAIGFE